MKKVLAARRYRPILPFEVALFENEFPSPALEATQSTSEVSRHQITS